MLSNTLTLILAGGKGTRLEPLTTQRAKPAVPFGGKYRIIDFSLSNCLHSGLRRILVLTQYKSHSLQKHLRDGWSIFNPELGEYITTVPPQMRTGERFYSGTADAIYQNIYLLERSSAKWVLILSGDHIYRMDYAPMIKFHTENNAAATVACMDVNIQEANQFGVLELDEQSRIVDFNEKPQSPKPSRHNPGVALASMGVYVFSMQELLNAVSNDHSDENSSHDFGKDVIPKMVGDKRLFGYQFGGSLGRVSQDRYWRDVGTIDAYYQANMDLLKPVPPLNLYQRDWPIRTYQRQYPPARTSPGDDGGEGIFINSIVAGGVIISGGNVQESVLFSNVIVNVDAVIQKSIIFESVEVGAYAQIVNAIVDKHVKIPNGERIGFDLAKDRERFTVSPGGIVVVPKGYQFH